MSAEKETKKRSRASVACAACRMRRTKCVFMSGEGVCKQCQRSKVDCIISHDDERKRPSSRAHVEFLTTRVRLLEETLRQKNHVGAFAPAPESEQEDHWDIIDVDLGLETTTGPSDTDIFNTSQRLEFPMQETQFRPTPDEAVATQPPMDCSQTVNHPPMLAYHQPSHSGQSKRLLQCILSTDGHWNHDKDTGYTRYYAPTSNVHVYNEIVPASSTADTWEQRRRISRVIKDLSTETHDYLMELFWTQHNTILHVVNKEAYYQDKENDNVRYYSGFLHICILAMGLCYADKSRPDIQRLTFGDEESSLLREARYLSEYAVNHSAELTRIQALLLLGDLECGLARDNSGWMYTGLACRLALDMGLHLDHTQLEVSQEEVQNRALIFSACIVYDQYYALWLGRPPHIRQCDLDNNRLAIQRSSLEAYLGSEHERKHETQIYVALLELIEHAFYITDNTLKKPEPLNPEAYFSIAGFDQRLRAWYRKLPLELKWSPTNAATAPQSYFLLHQQFHSLLITAYRGFAQYSLPDCQLDGMSTNHKVSLEYGALGHYIQLSRTICFDGAIQVARIAQCHRKRFHTCRTAVASMQHMGTAATALIAAIARLTDPLEQMYPLQHLRTLTDSLEDMAHTYRPAKHMLGVLNPVINGFGWNTDHPMDLVTHISSQSQPVALSTISTESRRTPTESLATRAESHDTDMSILESSSNTFKLMDVSLNTGSRPQTMSQIRSTPVTSYHHDHDFNAFDAAMMLSPQSDLMKQFTGPQTDRQVLAEYTALQARSLPLPETMESTYGKTSNVQCGTVAAFSHRPASLPTVDLAEQLSWDDIFRQTGDNIG